MSLVFWTLLHHWRSWWKIDLTAKKSHKGFKPFLKFLSSKKWSKSSIPLRPVFCVWICVCTCSVSGTPCTASASYGSTSLPWTPWRSWSQARIFGHHRQALQWLQVQRAESPPSLYSTGSVLYFYFVFIISNYLHFISMALVSFAQSPL